MNARITLLLLPALVLAGCQSTPERFEGVRGYQADVSGETVSLTYTDVASTAWSTIRERALKACVDVTGHDADNLEFDEQQRTEFTQQVPTVISVPTRHFPPSAAYDSGTGVAPSPAGPEIMMQYETVTRTARLRQIQGNCEVKDAGLSAGTD